MHRNAIYWLSASTSTPLTWLIRSDLQLAHYLSAATSFLLLLLLLLLLFLARWRGRGWEVGVAQFTWKLTHGSNSLIGLAPSANSTRFEIQIGLLLRARLRIPLVPRHSTPLPYFLLSVQMKQSNLQLGSTGISTRLPSLHLPSSSRVVMDTPTAASTLQAEYR